MKTTMKGLLIGSCVAACSLAGSLQAQTEANPITTALKSNMERMQANLVGAAETMPANKYSYKPTPAQMSFGQLMLHVSGSNEFMCATIAGTKAPQREKLTATASKDALVARLKQSFEYCTTTLASVNDSGLGEMVPFFGGRKISKGGAMMGLAADWADHYGAAAYDLRLNGLLPPSAQHKADN
jgi:hypothetical protein